MVSKNLCHNPIFSKLNIEPGVCGYLDCPDFRIYNIHLDLSPDIRKKQIKYLSDHSESYDKPIIIGGDFNEYIIPIFSHPFNLVGYGTSYYCDKDDPDNETPIDHIYEKGFNFVGYNTSYYCDKDNPDNETSVDHIYEKRFNCAPIYIINNLESALKFHGSDHIPISVILSYKSKNVI